ncbi:BBSome complex member BBS7 [Lepeophtheirus salmonis]|uniref:BBSome complex member BBS7 n=1 Tax=Lepeophtheirus salmonis TaxID=72036 RepID=UPI001AE1E05D|nr:Bardet-Biedl syndrome 7 protein homolog [Lepeophtheirus salmonis]
MEIELNRVDYIRVGLTNPKCLKLLPQLPESGKSQQKVAIGDADGVLQLFSLKKKEISFLFKTLPECHPITSLELGGALGTIKDKIFIAIGNEVKGYSKKGKLFLDFETNLTEKIASMSISGSDLIVCGKHVYNHYRDCRDVNHYLCPDEINDALILPGEKVSHLTSVLASGDRTLKVLRDGSSSQIWLTADLPGPPSVLHLFYNDGGEHGNEVLYGTTDGKLGLIELINRGSDNGKRWILDDQDGMARGSVQCIENYDITGNGIKDLIIGRTDGNVELYSYEDDESPPVLKFTHNTGESITSVVGGTVGTSGYDEIIISTYSGWIFGLTTETKDSKIKIESEKAELDSETRQKLTKLRQEVEQLQNKVNVERDKYQKFAQASTQSNNDAISAIPSLKVNDHLVLSQADASYVLSLEIQTSIDNVLLQSEVPLDLLDVEKNSAVVSYSTCDPESGNVLLTTYRCQANTTRLEIKIRTIEGQYGTLRAYITPRLQPKCCQVQEYKVKPLSLHMRKRFYNDARPRNILRLTGPFTLAEMHFWIHFCLPEVPEKSPSEDMAQLCFESTFLGTILKIEYGKGTAVFQSDNISTISILKDVLTKEATQKRTPLDIECDVNEESVYHTLNLIHPKLEAQLLLAKQVALIEPLRDLAANEPDTNFLSPEYKFILENSETLRNQFKKQPAHLERLYGMITDLFIDQHKFKGNNVKSKVSNLLEVLDKYSLESLIEFFKES